jgi:cytochrome P450
MRHITLFKPSTQWDQRLLTLDPVALNHVLRNTNIYEKPWQSRRYISSLIGYGMLSTEGNVHKRQKRVATPAFTIQNLRAFAPIVFEKGSRLRNRWRDIVNKNGGSEAMIDVCVWLSRATFDVMGAAGSCMVSLSRVLLCSSFSRF